MFIMRSLRVKLIFTFLAISVAGTLLASLFIGQLNERAFNDLLQEQQRANFAQIALTYYQNTGSWVGFAQAMRNQLQPPQPGQQPAPSPLFALADSNGRIIIPSDSYRRDTIAKSDAIAQGMPLQLDGVLVGTVLSVNQPPPRNPVEEAYAKQVNRALLYGALAATAVAIVLALVMARTLTRPLQELASASRAMAQGKLQQQVPVRTQDELGELAFAFNQMSDELARANQQRRQMTADIAHDLRTPLTVLSGYLEAMEDGTLTPTPTRLALMHQEVHTLKRLVEDLRTLSLADAGKLALQKEPINPTELLLQVQASYTHQATQQEVALQTHSSPDLPVIALDQARMRQVLGNLISNALRYTPSGGSITLAALIATGNGSQSTAPNPQIPDSKSWPPAHGLQITVSDTGSGIPAADLPHIFDRFYRGDKARQEGAGESGLGLAIVKSLVAAHGGTITAVSPALASGLGTCFTITLPIT